MNKRTKLNPVVLLPFNRGPYPSYSWRGSHGDDAADLIEVQKDFLVYEGAFTATELEDFSGVGTEGAEQGMNMMWAAMALTIAQTTCNRAIYALMEAPAYGYSTSTQAMWVNNKASTFYAGEECACYATSTCNDPTVTVSNRGWLPGSPFPVEAGADGNDYAADSTSPNSPWFESMVFPENPSGRIKVGRLPANRRVCDGVYLFPMYFGGENYSIPMDKKPDCISWAFSVTKVYSASVRAGTILYKKSALSTIGADISEDGSGEVAFGDETPYASSLTTITSMLSDMSHGLYSEWSWYGQIQIYEMIMARPMASPASWLGAYSGLIKEKWDAIISGFAGCPYISITNPHAGAYVFFKMIGGNVGKSASSYISDFFEDVLNVKATTYNWGWRGSDPADYHGAGYGLYDFVRLQLYRDLAVYVEVGRRAQIVCGGGNLPGLPTAAAWQAASTSRRRLSLSSREDVARHLKSLPEFAKTDIDLLAQNHVKRAAIDRTIDENCAPQFKSDCLMKHM